jgi:uncharacterized protein
MADRDQSQTSNRGFASMDRQKQREIASKGGRASGGNFRNNPGRAAVAGRKGGQSVPASERSFSRNPALAAEAGRKGGEHSHTGPGTRARRDAEPAEANPASGARRYRRGGADPQIGDEDQAARPVAAELTEVAVETNGDRDEEGNETR